MTRRRHSQVFLINDRIARRLVELSGVKRGDAVLEIGPGKGILTRHLLARGVRLTAVEIDEALCSHLRERFAGEIAAEQLKLRRGDFLRLEARRVVPAGACVVANLPYHLSTPILLSLLENAPHFRLMLLTLQEEFVRRLAANPGEKDYGALSVFLRCRSDARQVLRIRRREFRPVPTVNSAAVLIRPRTRAQIKRPPGKDFSSFVQLLFSQRRKKLAGALYILGGKRVGRQDVSALLLHLGLDASLRAGMFSESELYKLYQGWKSLASKAARKKGKGD